MDPLYDILAPHLEPASSASTTSSSAPSPQTNTYLARLSTLSLPALTTTEPASLLQTANSHLRNLQALSKRSHKAVIASSEHLAHLQDLLPDFSTQASELHDAIPAVESAASDFATKYDRSSNIDNVVLERRKRALLLARNVDRVGDVLELPSLLASTVSAAQAASASATAGSSSTSYASALDLHAHIKRLSGLYPHSELVKGVAKQAELEIENLTGILIATLQSPGLKLAAAMRTVGYLRRVAPELTEEAMNITKPAALSTKSLDLSAPQKPNDGALGAVFLLCRLHTMHTMLEALEPLRDLADQESAQRTRQSNGGKKAAPAATGTQTERYLKRYIEIFREQSFNIVSMYRSIFPSGLPSPDEPSEKSASEDPLLPLPAPLSSFALHLVDLMMAALRSYLPNVSDKSSRESLLTQVLYCAGSFGRLGADFGMAIALLEDDLAMDQDEEEEPEWVAVMKKHRVQASRLEVLARGVGSSRKASAEIVSPSAAVGAG